MLRNSRLLKIAVLFSSLTLLGSCTRKFDPLLSDQTDPYLKLCFVGDTGKRSSAQQVVARALEWEKCHEIFHLGDIIYPRGIENEKDSELESRFFSYYRSLTEKDHHPKFHMVMGNHDDLGSVGAWKKIADMHPFVFFPERYWMKRMEDVCVVGLDSNLFLKKKHHLKLMNQDMWYQDIGPVLKNCRVKIAMAHHPLKSSALKKREARGILKKFLEEKVTDRVDYYISGHEHILSHEGKFKNAQLFIAGAGGALERGRNPGYLTLELTARHDPEVVVYLKEILEDGRFKIRSFPRTLKKPSQVP